MEGSLAKRPASFLRERTQHARDVMAATTRAQDRYLATLARAQAQLIEDMKTILGALTEDTATEPVVDAPAAEASPPTQ